MKFLEKRIWLMKLFEHIHPDELDQNDIQKSTMFYFFIQKTIHITMKQ